MTEQRIQLRPAQTLEQIFTTLSPEPLLTEDQFKAFYGSKINEVRGGDKTKRLRDGLTRQWGGLPYKAFIVGHSGVGKSTELTKLMQQISDKYRSVRISATAEFDPVGFRPFDLVLLMMMEVAERTAMPINDGGAGEQPPDERLKEILEWFATEEVTHIKTDEGAVEIGAGLGVDGGSLWAKALGLFASVKGEIKYATAREQKIVEHRLKRISSLVSTANRLLADCNDLLRKATGREWLVMVEDFEKTGFPAALIRELVLNYSNVFRDLRTHLIFTIPVELAFSSSQDLPFPSDRVIAIPDTPVYDREHRSQDAGREALAEILRARVSDQLFDPGQMNRLIVASGGNIRDLFTLVVEATEWAKASDPTAARIRETDATTSIAKLRIEYERRLGDDPYDPRPIPYQEKADRLLKIYKVDADARIPDAILYSLLRSRVVQEFDGERWFGVHPLVVDVLGRQGRLNALPDGRFPGGTE